jgi:putative membrane protein
MTDDRKSNDDTRTRLAGERTLLAWIRTGVALMGLGFVVARFGLFLSELAAIDAAPHPPRAGFSLWIGTALIVLGVIVSLVAAWEHARFLRQLEEQLAYRPPRRSLSILVAVALAAIGLCMAVYLLLAGLGR